MLSVFRDGTLHGQAELTVQGLRIGRGSENDIVLEDAAKRVSRLHAELRLEGDGTITLTDLQSANGTWIAGERVDTEALQPGVPFTIGPYRLMLEEQTETERAAFIPESLGGDSSVPPGPESVAQAPPPPPGARRKGDTTKTQSAWKVAAGGAMDLALKHRWAALIGGGAIVLVGALGIWSMTSRSDALPEHPSNVPPAEPTPPPSPPQSTAVDPATQHLDEADKLLVQGDKTSAETALRDHIALVLQQDPGNARALEQKTVAERIINPPVTVVPPAPSGGAIPITPGIVSSVPRHPRESEAEYARRARTGEARLNEGRTALEKGDFKTAIAVLDSLLGDEPDYADAKMLLARARASRSDAAKRLAADADELAKAGSLPEAIAAFRRADALDPAVGGAARIADLQTRMAREGEDAFNDGYNFSMSQRNDQAVPLLRKAYWYLPDGHPDKARARAELERLGASLK